MNFKTIVFAAIIAFVTTGLSAQSIVGKWKTIDDNTGKERSVVEIYEKDGRFFGKIIQLFREPGEDPDPVCDECKGAKKNKKIIGMEIATTKISSGNPIRQ